MLSRSNYQTRVTIYGEFSFILENTFEEALEMIGSWKHHNRIVKLLEQIRGVRMPKVKPISILMKFFGRRDNQSLTDFADEVKKLSPEEKADLVDLAAKELGIDVDWGD